MPLSINQIPIPVPSSTDPANFSARGDAVFGAFPDFITQTNAVASEAAANRDLAEASKTAAANSETNAATYAANATTSANNASSSSVASLWVSGTTYAINDKRVSPITGQVYRRKTAGAGTTDPSLDSTNWYAVLLDADTQYPSIKPTLNLDFANSGKLDPRITFTRASTATYFDRLGVLRTAINNEPRFDYDPVTLEAKGLLIEESRTNLLIASEDISGWFKQGCSVQTNNCISPSGDLTADTIVEDTGVGTRHGVYRSDISFINGTMTVSAYLRPGLRSKLNYVVYNAVGFSAGSSILDIASGTPVGNGWYRVSWTFTPTSATGGWVEIWPADSSGNINYAGSGQAAFDLWGVQLEAGSFPTSYIPTTTTAVTRQADNAVMTGANFSSWYNQGEGTICVESQWGGEQPDGAVIAIEGASYNRIRLRETPSSTEGIVQGTGVNFIASSASGSKRKSTFSLKNSDLALTANGSTPVTNSGPSTLPIVTYLAIGSSPADGTVFKWNGAIRRITYYPKRLPNYQLQILTK